MNPVGQTLALTRENHSNCAQAVLTVFGKPYGMTGESAKIPGRVLGGGLGHQVETCGYLSGALLVMAMAHDKSDEGIAGKESFAAARTFVDRFKKTRGSCRCKELIGADYSTPGGKKRSPKRNCLPRHAFAITVPVRMRPKF